jgi:8-oxo-dGTP diphosphatase
MPAPKTPALTVDIIIELKDRPDVPIVLIRRKNPPHGWALPGGFVDVGEAVEHAAVREAEEETALRVTLKMLLGCYSDPARDPRGHTASVVYVAEAEGEPRAQDDAAGVAVFSPEALPDPLVFDHARILRDYLTWRQRGVVPSPENP